MGEKLTWTGLTIMLASPVFGLGKIIVAIGAIVMIIGIILMWSNK